MNTQTDHAKEALKRDRAALVAELTDAGARWASNGKDCCCPWHQDSNPSAGVYEANDGWRFKCFACGERAMDVFDVMAKRQGRPVADVMRDWQKDQQAPRPEKPAPQPAARDRARLRHYPTLEAVKEAARYQGPDEPRLPEPEDTYPYTNPATGTPDLVVIRFRLPDGKKTFRQASPDAGAWVLKGPEGLWPVFNRARVRDAADVVLVEGENKVKALTPILPAGWAATCNAGGGEKDKAALTDWSPLAGKRVWLWPDNDPPDPKTGRRTGIEHMKSVAAELAKLSPPAECFWIEPDRLDLPAKGDAVDWVQKQRAAGITEPTALMDRLDAEVLATAAPLRPSAPLRQHYADVAAGKLYSVPWPWPLLDKATLALQPGHITMLCGEPGAGKSFLLVEALWHWLHERGERAAGLMLELSATFHARRLHAMLAEQPGLLNMAWVKEHAQEADALYHRHAADLDRFWSALDTVPRGTAVTSALVLDWLRRRCRAGARVLAVDPFTALADDKPWLADVEFLLPAQKLAEEYGASVVLTIHPDRGGRKMARSEAVRRFVDTVVWLARHETPRASRVVNAGGSKVPARHNRTVRVTKARLAAGTGGELAYDFCPRRLRFAELGVIVGGDTSDATGEGE